MLHSVISLLISKMVQIKGRENSLKISSPVNHVHNMNESSTDPVHAAKSTIA